MSGVDHADRAVVCWRKVMSKVRLFDKRRAFCNDKLKYTSWVMLLFQGHKESVSGLAWKATGLAKLSFKCNPAVQGISERVVEVFKGGVLCTALKCGVPQVRLNLKSNLEWGATPAAVSPSRCEFMWLWHGLCLEVPDLPSCCSAGVHRCDHQSHFWCRTLSEWRTSPGIAPVGSAQGTGVPRAR